MKSVIAAFQFLTRIPLPVGEDYDPKLLGSSSAWFPLVGLVIGVLLVACNRLLGCAFPSSVVAVLLIVVELLLTGGLHLDGLMDTVDGLMGSREREKALAIMRDSRVGAMGVIAAIMVVLVKWALLSTVLDAAKGWTVWTVLLLMPVFGRWSMVLGLYVYPYARSEDGLGKLFAAGTGRLQIFVASLFTLAAAWFLGRFIGLITFLGVLVFACIHSYCMARRIGGLTGDTYGTLEELGEAAALMFLVALYGLH